MIAVSVHRETSSVLPVTETPIITA